jgi:D123
MNSGMSQTLKQKSPRPSKISGAPISSQNGLAVKIVRNARHFSSEYLTKSFSPDIFDFLLTRDLSKGHILDFNPFAPKTDPLLFTYEELRDLIPPATRLPVLRVIDSPSHPAAAANAPAHQHNMIPFEAVSMSNGLNIEEFADIWKDSLKESMTDMI